MSAAQVGKSECLLNTIGRTIDRDPAPILFIMPTAEMTQAMSKGIKTNAGQKHFAEESDQLHEARLKVGVCKGELESIKVELRALDVGFEQWRTEAVNNRTERQRYGA